jgi:hypothetical protein
MNTKIHSTSRRSFLKGLAIGAGGYVLGSSLTHPKEVVGQSIQGNLDKVPLEARWNIAAGGLVGYQVNLAKTNFDKEGREKYIEYAKKNSPIVGARGKGLADRFGFTGNDAKSAAEIIPAAITVFYGPSQKYEIEEATAEKARVKCLECAYWNAVKAQKFTDDLCSAHSHYYWEGFAKAINPKLTSTLVKARPRGDSVCEWVIELKA